MSTDVLHWTSARGRRHGYIHGVYRVHCTSTLIRCNCYTNLTREWDQAKVVDIKRNKQPTLFENKLQLIIYSSTTNFHTGAYNHSNGWCEVFVCWFNFVFSFRFFHFHVIVRAATSTIIYRYNKLETNGKIMFKKWLLFMSTPLILHIASCINEIYKTFEWNIASWHTCWVHSYLYVHQKLHIHI